MKKSLLFLIGCVTFLNCTPILSQTKIAVFQDILFYDGYKNLDEIDSILALTNESINPVPEGCIRKKTSLVTTKLNPEQLNQFGGNITMQVIIKASCDNYDRIGNVNLVLVPKDDNTYLSDEEVSPDVKYLEIGRFITPFMNKNYRLDSVPYTFKINYLKQILKEQSLIDKYDFWIELGVFGVPYAAHTQISGCAGRFEVFFGSLFFETSEPIENTHSNVLIPLLCNSAFNNYQENATDEIGKTERTIHFSTNEKLYGVQFVLVTSNHGANENGEEYNRREHFAYYNDSLVLSYTPGRTSCEPFRKYNTQGNGIYGYSMKTDEQWQSFSNWCPGDKIDNRIIPIGNIETGDHTFKIKVPQAQFVKKEGNFPLSLFLLGSTDPGFVSINKASKESSFSCIILYPNPVQSTCYIESNIPVNEVILYNLNGQKVYSGNSNQINIQHLNPGCYSACIYLNNGYRYVQKIIKR